MGRRSINTTKSGKYMNPTDQARKEARKKELKKNKKQRQMVRAAVLKGKDPGQIIEEMEKIDEMEYNVYQPSPLNEKVLKEKRKKLKETLDRVMRLYHNDDPELWAELKRKEVEYEKRRNKKVQYYESVKHAQSVQIDDIPLPQVNDLPPIPGNFTAPPRIPIPAAIPFPPFIPAPPQSILKKSIEKPEEKPVPKGKKESPGCPPGPPPNLLDMKELDDDYEEEIRPKKAKSIRFSDEVKPKKVVDNVENKEETGKSEDAEIIKPTSLQQRMLALSGQNIDEFMKEMENVQKKKEQERASDLHDRITAIGNEKEKDDEKEKQLPVKEKQPAQPAPIKPLPTVILPSGPPPAPIGLPPQPNILFRPPPLRSTGMAIRMPPGPPPGRPGMPPGPPPGMPPRLGIRMPPGPPPGLPPRHMHQSNQKHQQIISGPGGMNILSAAPQLVSSKDPKSATITAKPQIRNLSADVTRFVPSTLRVKREDKQKPKQHYNQQQHHHSHQFHHQQQHQNNHHHHQPLQQNQHHHHHHHNQYHDRKQEPHSRNMGDMAGGVPIPTKGHTKDDAYMQFMREMQGLL